MKLALTEPQVRAIRGLLDQANSGDQVRET
jgi:hypothetical protein